MRSAPRLQRHQSEKGNQHQSSPACNWATIGSCACVVATGGAKRSAMARMATKNTGVRKRPKKLTPSIPEKTATPIACRISAPAPDAKTRGTTPMMKAKDVMRMGRSRSRAASSAADTRSAPADSWRRISGEVGRRESVVVPHERRTVCLPDGRDRAYGHHHAVRIPNLELGDVLRNGAVTRVGLRDDLIRAAELVEIVDVFRAKVCLEGLEQVA